MLVPLSAFHRLMRPHLPDTPRPTLDNALRLSAADWCARTLAWRHVSEIDVTEQGEAIAAPGHAAIHKIQQAEFDGYPISPIRYGELPPRERDAVGPPRWISQVQPNTVTLAPFQPGRLTLTLYLKPATGVVPAYGTVPDDPMADAADEVPAFLLEQDAEPIVAGALGRLMLMPGVAWSNPNLGMMHEARFERAASNVFDRSERGQQDAPVRVRMQFL